MIFYILKKNYSLSRKKILDIILKMASLDADADEQVISVNETFRSLDRTLYLPTEPQIPGVP